MGKEPPRSGWAQYTRATFNFKNSKYGLVKLTTRSRPTAYSRGLNSNVSHITRIEIVGRTSHVLYKAMWDHPTYIRHCEVSKRGLVEELKLLEDEMDAELSKLNEFEQDSFFREVNDHWIETAETLPRLQWYSQLMIAYGFFEKILNDLCLEQQQISGSKLSLKDLHGQGISRAQNYLAKVIGINNVFSSQDWQTIRQLGILRNSIAHRDGFVDYEPDKPQSTYSQISKIKGVELRQETMAQEDAQIFFHDSVVVDALMLFDSFFRTISSELENCQ